MGEFSFLRPKARHCCIPTPTGRTYVVRYRSHLSQGPRLAITENPELGRQLGCWLPIPRLPEQRDYVGDQLLQRSRGIGPETLDDEFELFVCGEGDEARFGGPLIKRVPFTPQSIGGSRYGGGDDTGIQCVAQEDSPPTRGWLASSANTFAASDET